MGVAEWVATNIMDHTLPKLEGSLIIQQTESALSVIKGTSAALCLFLVIMFIITIIFLDILIKHRTQTRHLNYVRSHYGDNVETTARTYANLIKFHAECLQRSDIGIDAERTNVFLIGAGETAEAYLRHDREFADDDILQSLLPRTQPFVFRTITDALDTLDQCCTSEENLPKTLFVLLLISSRDPSLERHEHEAFQMPSSLLDHCYAIVGTGRGGNGAPAHKLSKGSKRPNGERIVWSPPDIAGICFY